MRRLFTILLFMLVFSGVKGQLFNVTNFTGTTLYGTYGVTVTSAGSFTTYVDPCLLAPTTYWIGVTGGGSYTYTFSKPVYTIYMDGEGLNPGEYVQIYINGSPYPITPADVLSYNVCPGGAALSFLSAGLFYGPTTGYNGGEIEISLCTPINSCELYCNGILAGIAYHFEIDTVRPPSCTQAISNSPCLNDTLFLDMTGDSTGATFVWTGPGGFTSTLQNPFIYPVTFADSGVYRVIKDISGALDTSYVDVPVHPYPIITASSNAPLCAGLIDTLKLTAEPDSTGETFSWSGPNAFTSSLQLPRVTGYNAADTGRYRVIAETRWGCKDTAYTDAGLVPPPPAPLISGQTVYCQGATFIPFTVTSYTGTLLWYNTGTGGVGGATPLTVSTAIPGVYKVWVSQIIGSCESPRDSITVRIVTTPLAPPVTGIFQYCQYVGTFTPLSATSTSADTALWYTAATGGTFSYTEPTVNIGVPGTYNFWVSQTDSGCKSPRTPVTITVHPQPAPPVISMQGPYCQYAITSPLTVAPSGAGDVLTWFGAGIPTSGTSLTPTPQANTPGADSFYVEETSSFNCVSPKILDTVRIIPKPATPITRDTSYCQAFKSVPLNLDVDSAGTGGGDRLNWYIYATQIDSIPVPLTNTPGTVTWWVSQTINGCQSDSVAISVTTIYLPKFTITPSSPWVCQFDSITLAYNGPSLQNSAFTWTLPQGDSLGAGSTLSDSMILVKFDSSDLDAFVTLRASDDNGKCATTDTIAIKVVPQPRAQPYTKSEVCLGDTTSLATTSQSADANSFVWYVDFNTLLANSSALNIIAASSNSGGPFEISWLDTGLHVIQLNSFSKEGCASKPYYDTVDVHAQPDASFSYKYNEATLCLEDSVYFTANTFAYNNSYLWSPAHSFTNVDKPAAFGVLEQNQTTITLTVTDPFGCKATTSQQLDPGSCCTVAFPNAFTPNGDGHDDVFRPLFTGYHNFHIFRIQNRWGQTVFESTNSVMQWDGTFNGVPQDMGVYFYYLKYDCGGKSIEVSGDVTLIR